MKVLKRILAVLVSIIMIPVLVVSALAAIVSIEVQPENFENLTTDIISSTLDKENLKKIKIADFEEYLPRDFREKLPADADIEAAVPVIFNSISGIESYVSLETVERIIEDNVVQDVVMAIINNEERDFVAMFDKYNIPLDGVQREELSKVGVGTIREGLSSQGYDIDEIVSGELIFGGSGVAAGSVPATNGFNQILEFLNPGFVVPIFIGVLGLFYLLLSLVLWNFKEGLCWWGAGVAIVGVVFLVLNFVKFEIVDFLMGMTRTSMNVAILAPAIERIMRPVIIVGILGILVGGGAIFGGVMLEKKAKK